MLFKEWRPKLKVVIGKPVGPFSTSLQGSEKRAELDEIGHEIMLSIAPLIPDERHGIYSADAKMRNEAKAVADYPFNDRSMRGQ